MKSLDSKLCQLRCKFIKCNAATVLFDPISQLLVLEEWVSLSQLEQLLQ